MRTENIFFTASQFTGELIEDGGKSLDLLI